MEAYRDVVLGLLHASGIALVVVLARVSKWLHAVVLKLDAERKGYEFQRNFLKNALEPKANDNLLRVVALVCFTRVGGNELDGLMVRLSH